MTKCAGVVLGCLAFLAACPADDDDAGDGGQDAGNTAGAAAHAGSAAGASGSASAGKGGGAGIASAGKGGAGAGKGGAGGTAGSAAGSGSAGTAGSAGTDDGGASGSKAGSGGSSACPPECLRAYECAKSCDATPFNNGCCACPAGTIDVITCSAGNDGHCGLPCTGAKPDDDVTAACQALTSEQDCNAYTGTGFPSRCEWQTAQTKPCLAP